MSGLLERIGRPVLRLLTSVNFAVAQILFLALLAVVGMTIRQLPGFAFRSLSDYEAAMADIHVRYDPVLGSGLVDALESLQVFQIFTSTWFIASIALLGVSIVVCTLDRTPRLWRQSAEVRVAQPEPFYDPKLPDRAATTGVAASDVREVLRRRRYKVREAEADGIAYLYGDRNQYVKMATLLTHLGLILFIVAALVTSLFGDEQGVIVADGDTATVESIGTPGLMVVKNLDFRAPGFLETGQARDFTTDLAVYRDGREIARKTIRVNDPLAVDGWTFHENGFGPAVRLIVRDAQGLPLWDGPVPLPDQAAGLPYGTQSVPGRDLGLQLLLQRQADGTGIVLVVPYRVIGETAATGGAAGLDGGPVTAPPDIEFLEAMAIAAGERQTTAEIDFSVEVAGFSDYVVLIAKRDPGQGFVWAAFVSLILGLAITFYLPRRRIWARLTDDGRLGLVARSDRYVDVDREFGRVLADLVARRRPTATAAPARDTAPAAAPAPDG